MSKGVQLGAVKTWYDEHGADHFRVVATKMGELAATEPYLDASELAAVQARTRRPGPDRRPDPPRPHSTGLTRALLAVGG